MNPLALFLSSTKNSPKSVFSSQMPQSTAPILTPSVKPLATPQPAPTPSSPSATSPVAPTAASTSPAKSQFVQSLATAPTGNLAASGSYSGTPINANGNFTTPSGAVVNGASGSLVTAPPVDPNANYKSAYNAYIQTLLPSDSENQATSYLNNLVLQSKKDYEAALDKPGQTLGFATGEAARVNKNNSFQIDAATNAVNALTGSRTATTAADKARVDFEKSLLPDAGTDFNLSPGQTRYDSKGNVIAALPAKATASSPKIIGSAAKGYYTVNDDGSVTPVNVSGDNTPAAGTPSWQEYLKAASDELAMDLNPDSDAYKQLRAQYDSLYSGKAKAPAATASASSNDWGL